jgi:acetolactate synthase-1/2/3 large subunit
VSGFGELADEIVSHGVTQAFGIPGGGASLTLIDALERRNVPFHLTRFEGAGALMAATVGRLAGRTGLSVSIKGPGLTNAIPGIAAAWFEGFPLVHVAEAYAPGAPAAQAHKRMNQGALVGPVSKGHGYWSRSSSCFADLASLSCAEEPGPVLMELPAAPVDAVAPTAPAEKVVGDLAAAVAAVRRSERPLVIAGSLARRRGLGAMLAKLECPVFSTAAAKGIVDEAAPNAAGPFTGVGLELTPEHLLLERCDLVIGIGLTARECLATKPFAAPLLAIEAVDTPGTAAFEPATRVAISDAESVLEAVAHKQWGLDVLSEVMTRLQSRMDEGMLPGSVFHAIERRFDRRARLVLDTGYFCTIGEHAVHARDTDLCLMSGQGRYMGAALPMALGAAMHDRTTPTIAVLGDGGIGMYLAEITLAARHRLPLLTVLMTDNAFASIRTRAMRDHLTERPLLMDGRSWVGAFDALGVPGTRAGSLREVEDALAAWTPLDGPAFLEVPFAPDEYEAMVTGIR